MWKFQKRKNKLGNKRTDFNGIKFASKLELALYQYLLQLKQLDEIHDIKCQVNVKLIDEVRHGKKVQIGYRPDFSAICNKTNQTFYYEAKGSLTDVYKLKEKLWRCFGPGKLFIYKGTYKNLKLTEIILPE